MKKVIMGALTGLVLQANADSLYVNENGFVGVGTNTPNKAVHVLGATGGPEALLRLEQTDQKKVRLALRNPNGAWTVDISADAKTFIITKVGEGGIFSINDRGELFLKDVQIH